MTRDGMINERPADGAADELCTQTANEYLFAKLSLIRGPCSANEVSRSNIKKEVLPSRPVFQTHTTRIYKCAAFVSGHVLRLTVNVDCLGTMRVSRFTNVCRGCHVWACWNLLFKFSSECNERAMYVIFRVEKLGKKRSSGLNARPSTNDVSTWKRSIFFPRVRRLEIRRFRSNNNDTLIIVRHSFSGVRLSLASTEYYFCLLTFRLWALISQTNYNVSRSSAADTRANIKKEVLPSRIPSRLVF